jgi:hypothetical protein
VRVTDEGLVRPAPSAPFKRQVSIDKETGNAVGDALSGANRWEVAQKGSQENAFVTLLKAILSVDGEPLLASKLNRAHSEPAEEFRPTQQGVLDRRRIMGQSGLFLQRLRR